jgi:hypothetical protein
MEYFCQEKWSFWAKNKAGKTPSTAGDSDFSRRLTWRYQVACITAEDGNVKAIFVGQKECGKAEARRSSSAKTHRRCHTRERGAHSKLHGTRRGMSLFYEASMNP